jgi:hypothetical protein
MMTTPLFSSGDASGGKGIFAGDFEKFEGDDRQDDPGAEQPERVVPVAECNDR